MSKPAAKTAKPTPATDPAGASKKRSKLKLALFALVPLVLAGGGYAGWTVYFADPAHGVETAAGGHGAGTGEAGAADAMHVSAVPPEVAAEISATHSFALSVLIAEPCGRAIDVPSLRAASDAEAIADGRIVNLSWIAAARRTAGITEKSCRFMLAEVRQAENHLVAAATTSAKKGASH